jgi:hypothetical protein
LRPQSHIVQIIGTDPRFSPWRSSLAQQKWPTYFSSHRGAFAENPIRARKILRSAPSQDFVTLAITARRFKPQFSKVHQNPYRKDIELLRSAFRAARLVTSKAQRLCSPGRDAVIARCLPFAATPQAPLRSSFRQRAITAVRSKSLRERVSIRLIVRLSRICAVLKTTVFEAPFQRDRSFPQRPFDAASPRGDCAVRFNGRHRLRVCWSE